MTKTYENSTNKRRVQKLLFQKIGYFPSNIVCMLGPTPDEYLKIIKNTIDDEYHGGCIHNYENREIIKDLGLTQSNIVTFNKDVFYANPQRIIDLDLMDTIIHNDYLLRHLFEKQRNKYQEQKKVFMFTLSMRAITIHMIKEFLQNLLQCTVVEYKQRINHNKIWQYFFTDDYKYKITTYIYTDTSRMISILIEYI